MYERQSEELRAQLEHTSRKLAFVKTPPKEQTVSFSSMVEQGQANTTVQVPGPNGATVIRVVPRQAVARATRV